MSISRPDEEHHFPNNLPIEVSYKNTQTYSKCSSYDPKVMAQGFVWHQIVVQHNGKISGREGVEEVLEAIFDVVEGEELFPVAYRVSSTLVLSVCTKLYKDYTNRELHLKWNLIHGSKEDRFLVRKCKAAINKLFEQNLRIQLSDASFVQLQVQFNVGAFKHGQVSPFAKLTDALNRLYLNMERVNGINGILNLSRFNDHPEFFDLVVNLGNRAVFEGVCKLIYRNDEKFRSVNGLILSDNRITTASPLTVFAGVDFAVLDLRNNKIMSSSRLCRDLNAVKADELLLAGNPVTKAANYPECLRPILKNFKLIDGIPAENLSKDYTPMDYGIDVNSDGYRIDRNNKEDLAKFRHSSDWHAIMIPDPGQEFTKEEIFDYFFITVSPTLADVYPCYYKFTAEEHQFLIRQCFDQLKYIADVCKMEIKIPRLSTGLESNMAHSHVHIDKVLRYYMLMNISPYKLGQVDPLDSIDKALTRRYNAINKLLNLDNFQNIEGLENIIINLSSSKILRRVMVQASKNCLASCVELRLAHNKITTADGLKVLSTMSNLKAIDLGNNWILDLADVKELSVLGLKTLRLDGNPLCAKYSFAGEYIKAVRKYFPELTKLDNTDIKKEGGINSQKNFLCDVKGYDFIDEFVPRYFKAFDSNERQNLKEKDKLVLKRRLMCEVLFNSKKTRLSEKFDELNDFIVTKTSISKEKLDFELRNFKSQFSEKWTACGRHAERFYSSESKWLNGDYQLYFTSSTGRPTVNFSESSHQTKRRKTSEENMVVTTINGVFYDQAPSIMDNDILMAFTRTFVMIPVKKHLGILSRAIKYQIVNEQLSIYNPTALQTKNAFKYFKTESQDNDHEMTVADKEALIVMFQGITNLKSVWCSRFLEDARWDFKKSLLLFLGFCDKKQILDTAFI